MAYSPYNFTCMRAHYIVLCIMSLDMYIYMYVYIYVYIYKYVHMWMQWYGVIYMDRFLLVFSK